MRTERRGSAGTPLNLPAYTNYVMRHSGEERLGKIHEQLEFSHIYLVPVDGPVTTSSDARIAYLEKRIRELELSKEQSQQSTPNSQPRRKFLFFCSTVGH